MLNWFCFCSIHNLIRNVIISTEKRLRTIGSSTISSSIPSLLSSPHSMTGNDSTPSQVSSRLHAFGELPPMNESGRWWFIIVDIDSFFMLSVLFFLPIAIRLHICHFLYKSRLASVVKRTRSSTWSIYIGKFSLKFIDKIYQENDEQQRAENRTLLHPYFNTESLKLMTDDASTRQEPLWGLDSLSLRPLRLCFYSPSAVWL